MLRPVKVDLGLKVSGVQSILCECKKYIWDIQVSPLKQDVKNIPASALASTGKICNSGS
jgi:hypothetical protein